jgi:hypothetical protein
MRLNAKVCFLPNRTIEEKNDLQNTCFRDKSLLTGEPTKLLTLSSESRGS